MSSDSPQDPILDLIIAEEELHQESTTEQSSNDDNREYGESSVVIEQENITSKVPISPEIKNAANDVVSPPIQGEGDLEIITVLAEQNDFRIEVEIDDYTVLDKSWGEVNIISSELAKASAYKEAGSYVMNIFGYSFNERFNVSIIPQSEVEFNLIRLELTMEGPYTYR
jgi:hypothetical protein